MNFPTRSRQEALTSTPTHYVILHHAQHCTHCAAIHEHTTIMLKGTLPARMGDISGAKVTQMSALKGAPQFNLPITHMDRPLESIPFCHDCGGRTSDLGNTVVSSLPLPPQLQNRTILSAARERPEAARPTTTKRTIRSVDDILSAL